MQTIKRSSAAFALVAAVGLQMMCTKLDIPVTKIARNVFSSATPPPVEAKHCPVYTCADGALAKELTVVVTVKDACSQMPGFVRALEDVVGTDTALIVTYPKFDSCDPLDLGVDFGPWRSWQTIPLPPSSSPMRGWLDAVPLIRTEYALLLHNDGYALDSFFACELVQSLKARDASYVVAAPMLYESKADGSLAAHATQSRLRLQGGHVRHDHSVAKALNRGGDIPEGDQADFLEDHGFVIKTQAIAGIIDPHASYTLEYIDMILSLKANKWKVLFVPSARLEFRIAEFSWRDVPYFMYKRSEATCHGTRDYLAAKWRAKFPNTGFWTYIKYTIVESHEYPASEISVLPWKQQASLFLGFFQMAGFNRYAVGGRTRTYVDLLMELDSGAYEAKQAGYFSSDSVALDGVATRELKRKAWAPGDLKPVPNASGAEDLLPTVAAPWFPTLEADMPLEYLPFAVAKLAFPDGTCADALGSGPGQFWAGFCGVAVQKPDGCECWVNMPTFKSRSLVADVLARVASVLKVPSRITTYLEMALGSTNPAGRHVRPVVSGWQARVTKALAANVRRASSDLPPADLAATLESTLARAALTVYTCGGAKDAQAESLEPCDAVHFGFSRADTVVHFSGRPPAPSELRAALAALN